MAFAGGGSRKTKKSRKKVARGGYGGARPEAATRAYGLRMSAEIRDAIKRAARVRKGNFGDCSEAGTDLRHAEALAKSSIKSPTLRDAVLRAIRNTAAKLRRDKGCKI